MKKKIEISEHELKSIDEFIKWCFDNPSPCEACDATLGKCENGCVAINTWEERQEYQFEKLSKEYQETYAFLESIGYVQKEIERLNYAKKMREYEILRNDAVVGIQKIFRINDIEVKEYRK